MKAMNQEIIKPTQVGQVVKFHTPLADEDPNGLYLVIEMLDTRVRIQDLNSGMSLPANTIVNLNDLTVVK